MSSHTFVICAYRDSPYLDAALRSARAQTMESELKIATSTPSAYIAETAARYGVPVLVNPRPGEGIAADWNFALSVCGTPYATILHQDDLYFPAFVEKSVAALEKRRDALIAFTDYCDCIGEDDFRRNRFYLVVKRLLLWCFWLKHAQRGRRAKQSALYLGNAICCPAVTYALERLGNTRFDAAYTVNLDWAMWLTLAEKEGSFVFVPEVLMAHRISASAETASAIADCRRLEEDRRIFTRLWGPRLGNLLLKFYCRSYRAAAPAGGGKAGSGNQRSG